MSAYTLAGMLRSRIERAARHQSETISLGQSFADQLHRFLLEADHGPEHDAGIWDVSSDGSNLNCDRGRDWGLRARQAHLEALSRRAAGGKWFATTNGADGLARLDNGTEAMFPVRCEWFEAEFIEALVNAYRSGDVVFAQDRPSASSDPEGADLVHEGSLTCPTPSSQRSGSTSGWSAPGGSSSAESLSRPAFEAETQPGINRPASSGKALTGKAPR